MKVCVVTTTNLDGDTNVYVFANEFAMGAWFVEQALETANDLLDMFPSHEEKKALEILVKDLEAGAYNQGPMGWGWDAWMVLQDIDKSDDPNGLTIQEGIYTVLEEYNGAGIG